MINLKPILCLFSNLELERFEKENGTRAGVRFLL